MDSVRKTQPLIEKDMPEYMKQRRAKILNATYQYFLTLLCMDKETAATVFPFDEKLLWVLFGYANTLIERKGLNVCCPGIYEEDGKSTLCNTEICGCKTCKLRELSEVIEPIKEAIEKHGFTVEMENETEMWIKTTDGKAWKVPIICNKNS